MSNWIGLVVVAVLACGSVGTLQGAAAPVRLDKELSDCGELLSHPQVASVITFVNGSDHRLSFSWVEPNTAALVHYRDLEAGETYAQQTYIGHLWAISAANGDVATHCVTRVQESYKAE